MGVDGLDDDHDEVEQMLLRKRSIDGVLVQEHGGASRSSKDRYAVERLNA